MNSSGGLAAKFNDVLSLVGNVGKGKTLYYMYMVNVSHAMLLGFRVCFTLYIVYTTQR